MSLKTFQAHLRSSLEASSCSKQIWPRAVILSSESQWMSMDVNGCQWMSMDVNGCQWMSMDVNGCQWMSMDVNGISGAETDLFDFYLPVH